MIAVLCMHFVQTLLNDRGLKNRKPVNVLFTNLKLLYGFNLYYHISHSIFTIQKIKLQCILHNVVQTKIGSWD